MTFKKNLFTVLAVVIFVMVVSYLVGIPQEYMVYGAAFLIAAGILFLATEDLLRKFYTERDKLTWQYFIGFVIVFIAVAVFLWAVKFEGNFDFFSRLGLAVFSGGVGFWWFYGYYRKSLQEAETKINERWDRTKKKLAKVKTPAKAVKIFNQALRYNLVSDDPFGSLNLDSPLAPFKEKLMTYEDLMGEDPEMVSELKNSTSGYISLLVGQMELQEPEIEGGE